MSRKYSTAIGRQAPLGRRMLCAAFLSMGTPHADTSIDGYSDLLR